MGPRVWRSLLLEGRVEVEEKERICLYRLLFFKDGRLVFFLLGSEGVEIVSVRGEGSGAHGERLDGSHERGVYGHFQGLEYVSSYGLCPQTPLWCNSWGRGTVV